MYIYFFIWLVLTLVRVYFHGEWSRDLTKPQVTYDSVFLVGYSLDIHKPDRPGTSEFSLLSVHGSFYRLVPNIKKINPSYFRNIILNWPLCTRFHNNKHFEPKELYERYPTAFRLIKKRTFRSSMKKMFPDKLDKSESLWVFELSALKANNSAQNQHLYVPYTPHIIFNMMA